MNSGSVRVLVVHPHSVVRRALAELVQYGGLAFAGEAGDASAASTVAAEAGPDVILLGVGAYGPGDGIRSVRQRVPGVPIVVIAHEAGERLLQDALLAGASGLLPVSADPEDLVDALVQAATKCRLGAKPGPDLSDARTEATPSWLVPARLTPRECEVFELLSTGMAPKAIAARLVLSRRTVDSHLASAYRKLGVNDRISAIRVFLGLRASPGQRAR